MTAGGAVATKREQSEAEDDEQVDMKKSAIDFHIQERPISAAAYGGRNNHRLLVSSDGQFSDSKFKQEQALAEFLQRIGSNQFQVPSVGQRPQDMASLRATNRELISVQDLLREGHLFHPQTNLSTKQGMQRTRSCYTSVINKGTPQNIVPNTQYVQTNAGKTGYVSVPNKSQQILEKAYKIQSKTLNQATPLSLKTEPMRSLKGCIYTEMVHLHKQKNRRKHGYINRKSKDRELSKTHTNLKTNKRGGTNEDLFYSPIDEYITDNFEKTQPQQNSQRSQRSNKSLDSRDSVPALTGGSHILMERDFFEKRYELEQNGQKLDLSDTHFQPIFFAKNVEQLRNDVTAQQALKQYRIFVRPEDFYAELKKEPLQQMDIAESLELRLRKQQEQDLADYFNRQAKPALTRQANIAFENKNSARESNRSRRQEGGRRGKQSSSQQSKKMQMKELEKRRLMYRMQRNSSNMLSNILSPLSVLKDPSSPVTVSEVTSMKAGGKQPTTPTTLFSVQETPIRKPAPLSEKQVQFINRLAASVPPKIKTRRLLQDKSRAPSQQTDQQPNSLSGENPFKQPRQSVVFSKDQKLSQIIKKSSVVSSSSEQSSNVFGISKAQVAQQKGSIKKEQSEPIDKSQGAKNVKVQGFRPFSASTGGGNYPKHHNKSTQREMVLDQIKKSKTPKGNDLVEKQQSQRQANNSQPPNKQQSLGLFSNSTKTTRIINQPKKNERSIISAEQAKVLPSNQKHSSDKLASGSISQKTGTVTDRKTDGSVVAALTKHITSKFSETQTNIESEFTTKTRFKRMSSNIQLQVTLPNLSQRIDSNQILSDRDSLVQYNGNDDDQNQKDKEIWQPSETGQLISDFAASLESPTTQKEIPMKDEERNNLNFLFSVTPLDDQFTYVQQTSGSFFVQKSSRSRRGTNESSKAIDELERELLDQTTLQQQLTPPILDFQFMKIEIMKDKEESKIASETGKSSHDGNKKQILIDYQNLSTSSLVSSDSVMSINTPKENTLNAQKKLLYVEDVEESKQLTLKIEKNKKKFQMPKLQVQIVSSLGVNLKQGKNRQEKDQDKDKDILKTLQRIHPTQKPNTDRNIIQSFQDTSQGHHLDMTHVLNVPMTKFKRGTLRNPKEANEPSHKDEDFQSNSGLTPFFAKLRTKGAQSDFSFANDIAQRESQGKIESKRSKGSIASNQSRLITLGKKASNILLSGSGTSKKESRLGSHIQYSDTTSDERSRRVIDNIDFLELGAFDDNAADSQVGDDQTPKSAQVKVKPIFQIDYKR